MRAAVIIPTYNEASNIRPLLTDILGLGLDLWPIVVDDNSPDGTASIVKELGASHSEIRLISRPSKLGLGTAYIVGFEEALKLGATYILSMDADFSHNPRYLPQMLSVAEESDVVIGSRYVKGGAIVNWPWRRQILSRTANLVARHSLGLAPRDCTAGFRCYRQEVLERVAFETIRSQGYAFLIEILFRCAGMGFKISEVPIIFEERREGQSKISRREIALAVQTVVRLGHLRLGGMSKLVREFGRTASR